MEIINDPRIYYLIGALRDGCLTKDWTIKFSQKYKEWLSSTILPLFNEVFETSYSLGNIYPENKEKTTWSLSICNKKIWLQLKELIAEAPKTTEEQRLYIKGFWDADGGCPRDPTISKKIYIKFTQKDKRSLEQIKEILSQKFSIKAGTVRVSEITERGTIWRMTITNKRGILRFCDKIDSGHPIKQKRLFKIKHLLSSR
ncbi:MAG: hypothetical protein HYT72_01105 [Candidatus Aenigmarchaeota archaeon]|nr:hypothetical protein [Candidatus Aenigmarchaeota archaeon]